MLGTKKKESHQILLHLPAQELVETVDQHVSCSGLFWASLHDVRDNGRVWMGEAFSFVTLDLHGLYTALLVLLPPAKLLKHVCTVFQSARIILWTRLTWRRYLSGCDGAP